MSSYTSFALLGAGTLGKELLPVLASNPSISVFVFTRSSTKPDVPALPNVKIVQVDYTSLESLTTAFKTHHIDVVISTFGNAGLESGAQIVSADAAKAAGVRLFVLSEWGFSTVGHTEGLWGLKEDNAKHLKKIGLSSVRIFVSIDH